MDLMAIIMGIRASPESKVDDSGRALFDEVVMLCSFEQLTVTFGNFYTLVVLYS